MSVEADTIYHRVTVATVTLIYWINYDIMTYLFTYFINFLSTLKHAQHLSAGFDYTGKTNKKY